tara:strand:- start:426 stop:1082 length:657 start_codon:yes stop_codon:yes gene_type:complete
MSLTDRLKDVSSRTWGRSKKYVGLGGALAAHVPVHEGLHCASAAITGGACNGIAVEPDRTILSAPINLVNRTIELISNGFYRVQELDQAAGYAFIEHSNSTIGRMGHAISCALPEFVYLTGGIACVAQGMKNMGKKSKRLWGVFQTAVGMECGRRVLNYMHLDAGNSEFPGDYYLATRDVLEVVHLPGGWANTLTTVGVTGIFVGSCYAAKKVIDKLN